MPEPAGDYCDVLADTGDLVAEVKAVRAVVQAAAQGNQLAASWLAKHWRGLAQLLGEVETVLTSRN
jgi:hypothetical protein